MAINVKLCIVNYNADVVTITDFIMFEGPDFTKYGLLLLVGDYPARQLVLYEKNFCWMAFFGVEIRSGGVALNNGLCDTEGTWLKAFMFGSWGLSLLNYTVAPAL
jgi:hypothetical protein